MRRLTLGLLVCAFVGSLLWGVTGAEPPAPNRLGSPVGLQMVPMPGAPSDMQQEIVILDPGNRRLGVYQVDRNTGTISLKSVRNISWDLQLDAFNQQSPAPQEVRAMLEQK